MWGFLLNENMPSGSSSSDLSAILSLDVSFIALSGVVGTAGSGSGVVCRWGGGGGGGGGGGLGGVSGRRQVEEDARMKYIQT